MAIVTIRCNISEVVDGLSRAAQTQLPFAIAKALTMTAQDAQAAVVDEMHQEFTLRTSWWQKHTPWGIKVAPAKKHDYVSAVYTRAPWIVGFEAGEIRTPQGTFFAVPTRYVRRTKRSLIAKSAKPTALLAPGGRGFFAQMSSGKRGIFQRVGRKRLPIRLMYHLITRAQIRAILGMEKTVRATAIRVFGKNFWAALEDALRTMR